MIWELNGVYSSQRIKDHCTMLQLNFVPDLGGQLKRQATNLKYGMYLFQQNFDY